MLTVDFRAMGCDARACVDAASDEARRALDAIPAWLAAREAVLSRFDAASELSRLNAAGEVEGASQVLWDALEVALEAARATDGLVTPTVLASLEGIGYDRTFAEVVRDSLSPPATPRPAPPVSSVRRDAATRTVRLSDGVRLDLGGTAKGRSADLAVRLLAPFGAALVDLGGDVATAGGAGEPWPVAVHDPRGHDDDLELLLVRTAGVATSGRDFRRWSRAGVPQHHLIDPRTGAPAVTDVWTVTVVGPSALEAEIAAKRVMLLGAGAGLAWVEGMPALAALVVRDDGRVLTSERLGPYLWRDVA